MPIEFFFMANIIKQKMKFTREINFVKPSVFNFVGLTVFRKSLAIITLIIKYNGLNKWIQIERQGRSFKLCST